MKKVFVLASHCLGALTVAALAAAQDCPVKHLALTALDHAAMEAAYTASFRGLYHRDPTGAPGSGPDDIGYWIGSYDHYGAYSDTVCRAGWNAYTETRLSGLASADPALGDQPARFQPKGTSIEVLPVPPSPAPSPAGAGPVAIDYTPLLQQVLAAQQQLLMSQRQLLSVAQETNAHVVHIDRTVAQTVGRAAAFLGKYVSPAVLAWMAAKQL
jgi:hypothetical protein